MLLVKFDSSSTLVRTRMSKRPGLLSFSAARAENVVPRDGA
jgi:hypothetical protein